MVISSDEEADEDDQEAQQTSRKQGNRKQSGKKRTAQKQAIQQQSVQQQQVALPTAQQAQPVQNDVDQHGCNTLQQQMPFPTLSCAQRPIPGIADPSMYQNFEQFATYPISNAQGPTPTPLPFEQGADQTHGHLGPYPSIDPLGASLGNSYTSGRIIPEYGPVDCQNFGIQQDYSSETLGTSASEHGRVYNKDHQSIFKIDHFD